MFACPSAHSTSIKGRRDKNGDFAIEFIWRALTTGSHNEDVMRDDHVKSAKGKGVVAGVGRRMTGCDSPQV